MGTPPAANSVCSNNGSGLRDIATWQVWGRPEPTVRLTSAKTPLFTDSQKSLLCWWTTVTFWVRSESVSSGPWKNNDFLFPWYSHPGERLQGKSGGKNNYRFGDKGTSLRGVGHLCIEGFGSVNWLQSGNWVRGHDSVFMIQVKSSFTWPRTLLTHIRPSKNRAGFLPISALGAARSASQPTGLLELAVLMLFQLCCPPWPPQNAIHDYVLCLGPSSLDLIILLHSRILVQWYIKEKRHDC